MGRGVRGIHGYPSFEIFYVQSKENDFQSGKNRGKSSKERMREERGKKEGTGKEEKKKKKRRS
jgi:hypothetical protein